MDRRILWLLIGAALGFWVVPMIVSRVRGG